jgi:hypothetical protein
LPSKPVITEFVDDLPRRRPAWRPTGSAATGFREFRATSAAVPGGRRPLPRGVTTAAGSDVRRPARDTPAADGEQGAGTNWHGARVCEAGGGDRQETLVILSKQPPTAWIILPWGRVLFAVVHGGRRRLRGFGGVMALSLIAG